MHREFEIVSKTHGTHTVLIDEEDWGLVKYYGPWNVCKNVRSKHKDVFYVVTSSKQARLDGLGRIKLHRLITKCPSDKVVNHWNENTLDNRKANLIVCTRAENKRFRGPQANNTTGAKGVVREGNKFRAQIGNGRGKHTYLGVYDTIAEAAEAYDREAVKRHGKFVYLNSRERYDEYMADLEKNTGKKFETSEPSL